MPRWSQYIQGIPSKIEAFQRLVRSEKWGPQLSEILKGLSLNSEDINRKIPYWGPEQKKAPSGVTGVSPAPAVALWTLEYMTEHLVPSMQDVNYVKFEHDSAVRKLFGTAYPVTLERIMGEIYIESQNNDEQHRYYVDLRPLQRQSVNAGSLVGFSVGFGRFGTERLRFRLDTTEFKRNSSSAEIAVLNADKHSSCAWQSVDQLLSETLFTHYTGAGLKMFLTLTIYGR